MEAFDVVHELSRYYGYSPQQAEPAYHLLLQAKALDEEGDPRRMGLLCFFQMHNPELAEEIQRNEVDLKGLLKEIVFGQKEELPKKLEAALEQLFPQ